MLPTWFAVAAWLGISVALASASWLTIEQFRRPQHMWIMYVVWPVTALYMGPIALWAYYSMGLKTAKQKAFWQAVFVGVTHCGGGCTLGDIIAETVVFYTGFAFAGAMFPSYLIADYVLAYLLGIGFQYFSIAPMRGISGWRGIWAAMKADTLSLTAFEIGLFGWMAATHFWFFHPDLKPDEAAYWFMMQIGMCIGFLTAYPMNWWLIRRGVKEAM